MWLKPAHADIYFFCWQVPIKAWLGMKQKVFSKEILLRINAAKGMFDKKQIFHGWQKTKDGFYLDKFHQRNVWKSQTFLKRYRKSVSVSG